MKSLDSAEVLAITGTSRCLFGDNRQIRQICEIVRKVSRSSGPVLVRGESGTGKEVLARAIHHQSPRAAKPFIAVNAGAIPSELFESELFGHLKGSFTGADRDRIGRFDEADGGTLFLDEIGDLPLLHQVKLLRVLQSGEVRPVGGSQSHLVDARVVAATNRDLEEAVRKGTFREDLYFRLNLFTITIPPLRERPDDLPALARLLVERFATAQGLPGIPEIPPAVAQLLRDYPWPGNIRELENCLHFAVTMSEGGAIEVDDLPEMVRLGKHPFVVLPHRWEIPTAAIGGIEPLAEIERRYVLHVYEQMGGNKTRTAQALAISVRSLQMKLKLWQVS